MTYQMLPELKTQPFGQLRSDKLPCMRQVIYFGAEPHRGMHTINEVMTIQKEGHEKRIAAEKELYKMENELKQKLLQTNMYAAG